MKKRIGTAVIFTILLFLMFSSITVFGKLKKNVGYGYSLLRLDENSKGKTEIKKGKYKYILHNMRFKVKDSKGKTIFKKNNVVEAIVGKNTCYYVDWSNNYTSICKCNPVDRKTKVIAQYHDSEDAGYKLGDREDEYPEMQEDRPVVYIRKNALYVYSQYGDTSDLGVINLKNDKVRWLGNDYCDWIFYKNRIYTAELHNRKATIYSYDLYLKDKRREGSFKIKDEDEYGMTLMLFRKIDDKYLYCQPSLSLEIFKYKYR